MSIRVLAAIMFCLSVFSVFMASGVDRISFFIVALAWATIGMYLVRDGDEQD